jgi:hypothetical protein
MQSILQFLHDLVVTQAYAACSPGDEGVNLANCLTSSDGTAISERFGSVSSLVNLASITIFAAAGIIFLCMILFSGFKFIQSGTKGKDEARTIMTTAITGLIVIFVAYWIVQIVGLVLGINLVSFGV